MKRRHLTQSQRAFIAKDAMPWFAEEARKRHGMRTDLVEQIPRSEFGKARDHAAKAFEVNPHYITDAKKIERDEPELAAQLVLPVKARPTTTPCPPPSRSY